MHYPDEPYVRKYPRKTLTWHKLGWEGRAVKDAMLGEFDRAGILDLDGDDAAECVALITGIPLEVVAVGLERLLKTKTWTRTEGALVWPNYVEAQTCAKSDRARQAESRARRAEEASGVTARHAPSRNVTPNLAEPNSTEPISLEAGEGESTTESEVVPLPRPRPHGGRRRRGEPESWWQFPKGWKWSADTERAAAAEGITPVELREHVKYWTVKKWPIAVTDLDGELVLAFKGIKERRAKAGAEASGPPASNPYVWTPKRDHREFVKAKRLPPIEIAVDAYRASGRADKLGTLRADDDFMRRLECWAETGEFHPTGALPKPRETARGAA